MNDKTLEKILDRIEYCNYECGTEISEDCLECATELAIEYGVELQDVESIMLYGRNYIDKMYTIDECDGLHIVEMEE